MTKYVVRPHVFRALLPGLAAALLVAGQTRGGFGSVRGTVRDGSGAAVPEAAASFGNVRGGARRTVLSDEDGVFRLSEIPLGIYRLTVVAPGFAEGAEEIAVRSSLPVEVSVELRVAGSSTSLQVTAGPADSVETATTALATMDSALLDRLPSQNHATGLSDLITRTTPGVAADGNGFAHPLGEHADTSLSIDNQPITDQQAKIFSNQISAAVVESVEVITGAPPAEYGDKTSLIINIATRSALGRRPFGSFSSQAGSFGTWTEGLTYGAGLPRWGSFTALNAGATNRFLDTPEFRPLHARGNAESVFQRVDWQPDASNSLRMNLSAARSWFQTPNTDDSADAGQDQRSQIRSFNIAPAYSHVFSPAVLLNVNPFVRYDRAQYFPSRDPLADRPATLAQSRFLTNTGFRTDLSVFRGIHRAKLGMSYWRTGLREGFRIAVTDPAFNAVCLDPSGAADVNRSPRNAGECEAAGATGNPDFNSHLLPYDLSRGGSAYDFRGRAVVKETALFLQDSILLGRLTLSPGLRYDRYHGLTAAKLLQPRFGAAWRMPRTEVTLRLSYARLFETPYNENLIVASEAAADRRAANPFGSFRSSPPQPGYRNQFNAGLARAAGRYFSFDADYFWKYTKNAFDFDSLFLTPITFPIGWRKSKIDGLAARATLRDFRGFSAYMVLGHTRSRFFGPEIGGLVFSDAPDSSVFRIDHSEEFQQTTFVRYQRGKAGPWTSLTWRYNSGLALPGVVPDYAAALQLTGDEQAQMGLYCGNVSASRFHPLRTCGAADFGATRVVIPPPGEHNDDLRPTRVAPRNVFDFEIGMDNVLRTEAYKAQLRFTALNLTNAVALYNFLSTFSGTHFVTPRALQAELRLVF